MLQAIPPPAQVVPHGAQAASPHGAAGVAGVAEAIAASPVERPGKDVRPEDEGRPEDRRQRRHKEPPAGDEEPHLLDLFA